jgi:hypothetical protein
MQKTDLPDDAFLRHLSRLKYSKSKIKTLNK